MPGRRSNEIVRKIRKDDSLANPLDVAVTHSVDRVTESCRQNVWNFLIALKKKKCGNCGSKMGGKKRNFGQKRCKFTTAILSANIFATTHFPKQPNSKSYPTPPRAQPSHSGPWCAATRGLGAHRGAAEGAPPPSTRSAMVARRTVTLTLSDQSPKIWTEPPGRSGRPPDYEGKCSDWPPANCWAGPPSPGGWVFTIRTARSATRPATSPFSVRNGSRPHGRGGHPSPPCPLPANKESGDRWATRCPGSTHPPPPHLSHGWKQTKENYGMRPRTQMS